jgi:osmotically-inducible protein OsmY
MKDKNLKVTSHIFSRRFVLLFAGLALAGSIALPLQAAERPLDATVTYWVQEALRGDPLIDAASITATTKDGIVTLTGSVRNLGSKTAAVEEAKKIQGVVAVRDKITTDPVWRPDADIALDIRHRIVNSAIIEAHDIRVVSHAGKVTLEGHVASWVESQQAELLASETRGVREVANALVVDYESSRTDQEIKNDAVAALDLDVYLRGLPIDVAVTGGTVTLTGTVGNLYESDRARDAVRRVSHVKGVDNQLKVNWISGDRSRGKPPVLSDDQLQENVYSQLARDNRVDASKIVVDAFGGHVILSGSVAYGSQKKTATQDARDTVGVAWVTDDLIVRTLPREDSAIRSDVTFEMAVDRSLSGLNIDVAVKDGVVTLSGTVQTSYQKSHAQTVAWRPRGVKGVANLLDVARDLKYSDVQLEKKIESSLKWNWTTYWVHGDIDVDVDDGIAFLHGQVNTWSERAEAGRLASHTPGVWRVHNDLRVGDYPYSWNEWDDDYHDYPYGP